MYDLPEEFFILQKTAAFRPKAPRPKPTIGGAVKGLASRVPKPLLYGAPIAGGLYGLGKHISGLVSDAQQQPGVPEDAEGMAETLEAQQKRFSMGQ